MPKNGVAKLIPKNKGNTFLEFGFTGKLIKILTPRLRFDLLLIKREQNQNKKNKMPS